MAENGIRLLAKGQERSNDTWVTGINNNDLVIGPSGAGKTRSYVKPNLLQCDHSVIVADTKGSLVREIGPVLPQHGYRVLNIDFTDDGMAHLFQHEDRIRFEEFGKEKIALFLTVSDTDRSMDKLANLFYTQALQALCESADKDYPDSRLPVPVRFILDDFATNVRIPDFDKVISVIRSREIYVSLIIQSINQLYSLYGPDPGKTIINNCDNCLYLGGQDVDTANFISIKTNRSPNTILNMPLGNVWLFTRGQPPMQVEKYDLAGHPLYHETEEGGGSPPPRRIFPVRRLRCFLSVPIRCRMARSKLFGNARMMFTGRTGPALRNRIGIFVFAGAGLYWSVFCFCSPPALCLRKTPVQILPAHPADGGGDEQQQKARGARARGEQRARMEQRVHAQPFRVFQAREAQQRRQREQKQRYKQRPERAAGFLRERQRDAHHAGVRRKARKEHQREQQKQRDARCSRIFADAAYGRRPRGKAVIPRRHPDARQQAQYGYRAAHGKREP
ncbi:MAG: type IV secretory system conjugative DNA transfer family protein [Subdoligranulum sp.]|nr:type IV secretory system conjugative DNA transfer family protein [Subdoligranulum sp.]